MTLIRLEMKARERIFSKKIIIYVLLLEGDYYYVGQTTRLQRRLIEHLVGRGSATTKLSPPIALVEVFKIDTRGCKIGEIYEDYFVMKYIEKFGITKVKGGTFLGSVKKRENKFKFYHSVFLEASKTVNPSKYFLEKVILMIDIPF